MRLPPLMVQRCCIHLKDFFEDCCKEVQLCLQPFRPKTLQSINFCELKIVCQAVECQGKTDHYLTSQPFKVAGTVSVVCSEREETFRSITLEETYWHN